MGGGVSQPTVNDAREPIDGGQVERRQRGHFDPGQFESPLHEFAEHPDRIPGKAFPEAGVGGQSADQEFDVLVHRAVG